MDSEYPDPEDEYEMRFADELEMMDELGLFLYSQLICYLYTLHEWTKNCVLQNLMKADLP